MKKIHIKIIELVFLLSNHWAHCLLWSVHDITNTLHGRQRLIYLFIDNMYQLQTASWLVVELPVRLVFSVLKSCLV